MGKSKLSTLVRKYAPKKRTPDAIAADKNIKAKHPGKRVSASGKKYFESRPNRSDANRTKKFADGGKVTEPELLVDSHHGVYVPQIFVNSYDLTKFGFTKEQAEKYKQELSSPDNEEYWDAWDELLSNAKTEDGAYLDQHEDLWLVPEDFEGFDSYKKGGRTKAGIAADKNIKAKHPGKRVSASGKEYFESRPNRSDVNRIKKFATGGKAKEQEISFSEANEKFKDSGTISVPYNLHNRDDQKRAIKNYVTLASKRAGKHLINATWMTNEEMTIISPEGSYVVKGVSEKQYDKFWADRDFEENEEFAHGGKAAVNDNGVKFVRAKFSIPGVNPEKDELVYEGWHNPNYHWNGWAVPSFDKKTAIKILDEGGYKHRFDKGKLSFIDPNYEEDGWIEIPSHELKEGGKKITVYGVGDGWTWSEEGSATFAKGGRTKAGIAADKNIKAKHPGKRTSASGKEYFESRPNRSDANRTKKFADGGKVGDERIDDILHHYMVAALWSSTDMDTEENLDANYSVDDITPESKSKMRKIVSDFVNENYSDIEEAELTDEQVGHSLWLSHNGHGAGFFDYGTEAADRLDKAAGKIKSIDLYVSDDKRVTFAKGGRTKAAIAADKNIKAKHPGKRVSASGKKYFESRPNHSDANRTKKFATGGTLRPNENPWFGTDANLETSLHEYSFVMRKAVGKDMAEDEYQVLYKINDDAYDVSYVTEKYMDAIIKGEEWASEEDVKSFLETIGASDVEEWLGYSPATKLSDLLGYWGYEDILGSSYGQTWSKAKANTEIGVANDDDDLVEFIIPTWAMSALVNGDESGLSDEEQEKLKKFVDKTVEQFGNANLMTADEGSYFNWRNDIDGNLGADVEKMVLRPSKEYEKGGTTNQVEPKNYDYETRSKDDVSHVVGLWIDHYVTKPSAESAMKDLAYIKNRYQAGSVYNTFSPKYLSIYKFVYGWSSGWKASFSNERAQGKFYDEVGSGRVDYIIENGKAKKNKNFADGGQVAEYNFDDWSKYNDQDLAHDIELFAENDSDLYRQSYTPIVKNLKKKLDKGTFDVKLAAKLWMYYVQSADKKYQKEVAGKQPKGFMLSVNDRKLLAERFAESILNEYNINKLDGFAKGGDVSGDNIEDLFAKATDAGETIVDELVEDSNGFGYEEYYDRNTAEVEHKPMSGFIPFTNGGVSCTWFEHMSTLLGMGKRLPTNTLQASMEKAQEQSYEFAQNRFKEEYPEIVENLGEDKINYHDLYEEGYGSEAERLSEWENDYLSQEDTVMMQVGFYLYKPHNSEAIDGKPTCYVFGRVNMEGPYHREGNLEDYEEDKFTFHTEEGFKKKLTAALAKIKAWFEGGSYNNGKPLSMRRMKTGGSVTDTSVQYADLPEGEFARGGVARVANSEAKEYSENRLPFKGANLEGKELDNGDYAVLSYGHYPIWYYSKNEQKWYGNSTKYSVTTSKQTTQSRPTYDPVMLSHQELIEKMRQEDARFDLGGLMVKELYPMTLDNTTAAHAGSAIATQQQM